MPRVLIVDDEEAYRRHLEIALLPEGYEVRTARSGREAIDIGARFRPDVVLTDWMLKDDIHGVHVAQALRAVLAGAQVILITGFPSDDLRAGAAKAQVSDFIEKPFKLDRVRAAVRAASTARPDASRRLLAMMELDAGGAIVFANRRAKELLSHTEAGPDAGSLKDVFPADEIPDLDLACERWAVVRPRGRTPIVWHLRTQAPRNGGTRLVIVRKQDEPQLLGNALIEMLLESKEPKHVRWPFTGRVLIVDEEVLIRNVFVAMLEQCGAGCYAVRTPAEALRLIENDGGIQFVLLDIEIPDSDPADIVKQIKVVRSNVAVIGTSTSHRWEEAAAMGIELFLQKPWRIEDLINLVAGKIGACVDCGLPLPLRRPGPNDAPRSWVCRGCGARYRAILDTEASAETLRNAQLADID